MTPPAAPEAPALVRIRREGDRPRLDDLWFLTGSRCNLACIHCYVASSPRNDTLPALTLPEVRRFLEEGAGFGLRHAYFTGGEPFLNPEILPMLEAALERGREATVLTNGTRPLQRSLERVIALHARARGRFHVRVSLDHYEEARHDAIRGPGTFRLAVDAAVRLAAAGARPIVTVTPEVFRGNPVPPWRCEERFRALFGPLGGAVDVKLLPAVLPMGAQLGRLDRPPALAPVTEALLAASRIATGSLMCGAGRSVLKRDGRVRVYPCPIIYEVPAFDLGATLEESFSRAVPLSHPACGTYCCRPGDPPGSCANG